MPRKPPPKAQKGRPGKKGPRGRVFMVSKVNLGDGELRLCRLRIDKKGVEVRAYRGRKKWWLPLVAAAEAVAHRAQVRAAQRALGT